MKSKYISGVNVVLVLLTSTEENKQPFFGLISKGNSKSSREQKLFPGLKRKHSQMELKGPKNDISSLVQTLMLIL